MKTFFSGVKRYYLNIILFILTFFTTTVVGTLFYLSFQNPEKELSTEFLKNYLLSPKNYLSGLLYSLPLLIILFAHEMGHYLMCKKYEINATPPYFIPAPTLVGTFGAVIRIKEPIYSKIPLFDIGIAGPLMSFFLSIPVLIYGIGKSKIVYSLPSEGLNLGEPLIFKFIESLYFKNLPQNADILIHPIAFAGWFGILVTAFNLIPIGQLDGGHIFYAFSSNLYKKLTYFFVALLIFGGIVYWEGWFLWAILIMLFGVKHPPVFDQERELDSKRRLLFYLIIIIFLLSFTPTPLYFSK